MVEERFQALVSEHLASLTDRLVAVLKRLVEFPYPAEVAYLHFEVFTDGFTQEFPVRVFFLDADWNEFFSTDQGEARYPCDVDPQLLAIPHVYPQELEEPYLEEDEDLDTFGLATETLIPWFVESWRQAGGAGFPRGAFLGRHGHRELIDLVAGP